MVGPREEKLAVVLAAQQSLEADAAKRRALAMPSNSEKRREWVTAAAVVTAVAATLGFVLAVQ